MYIVNGLLKTIEEEIWETGCTRKYNFHQIDYNFSHEFIDGLVNELKTFTGSEDYELDSCEEKGRIDFQVYEDENGCPASEKYILEWKAGNKRLWLCTYTAYILKCEVISLKELL